MGLEGPMGASTQVSQVSPRYLSDGKDASPGTWLMCRCLRYLPYGDDERSSTWLMCWCLRYLSDGRHTPWYLADVSVSEVFV